MKHEVRVRRTFVFQGDDIAYSVEVIGDVTYITEPGERESDGNQVCVVVATAGLPEMLEALAAFVREEQAKP